MAIVLSEKIQGLLEGFYEIEVGHRVADFLITDPKLVRILETDKDTREVNEKLLLSEGEDGLDIALYVDQSVLDRLEIANPLSQVHDGNLSDLWVLVEGVSHFVYLVWCALHDREVTLLELELQAEIDKYITTLFLIQQQHGKVPSNLHYWLFERPVFDSRLARVELERYRQANRFAGKYCRRLEAKFLKKYSSGGLFGELRRFYRLPHHGKIRHIGYC